MSINKVFDFFGVGFDLLLYNWKEEINGYFERYC